MAIFPLAPDQTIAQMWSNGVISNRTYDSKSNRITKLRRSVVQTFAKVVDSFVDRCLWQVIPDLLLLCQQTCGIVDMTRRRH